jgi:hypothetical protein
MDSPFMIRWYYILLKVVRQGVVLATLDIRSNIRGK